MGDISADPVRRGIGIARALGCPKVSLQVRRANEDVVAFYEHLGYRIDDTIDLGKRLVVD